MQAEYCHCDFHGIRFNESGLCNELLCDTCGGNYFFAVELDRKKDGTIVHKGRSYLDADEQMIWKSCGGQANCCNFERYPVAVVCPKHGQRDTPFGCGYATCHKCGDVRLSETKAIHFHADCGGEVTIIPATMQWECRRCEKKNLAGREYMDVIRFHKTCGSQADACQLESEIIRV